MTTNENNGGNAACRKRLVYMYHCACLTVLFIRISLVEIYTNQLIFYQRGLPDIFFVFCPFYIKMAYYVKMN